MFIEFLTASFRENLDVSPSFGVTIVIPIELCSSDWTIGGATWMELRSRAVILPLSRLTFRRTPLL